jgi:hypothetical protein
MSFSLHDAGLTRSRADLLYEQVFNVRDFGAKGDETTNDIVAFQTALDKAAYDFTANKTVPAKTLVWVPPGRYRFAASGSLTSIIVKEGVTLQGSYGGPMSHGQFSGGTQDGTTFLIETNQENPTAPAFCQMKSRSAIRGISFFWPNQTVERTTPLGYPFAIGKNPDAGSAVNVTIENIEFQNAYQGIDVRNIGRHLVRNVVGQALSIGVLIDEVHDVGRLENIQFIPIWSGFSRNPETGVITPPIAKWQFENGTAFLIKTTDGEMVTNCFAIRYNRGVHIAISNDPPQAWVQFQGLSLDECRIGIDIDTAEPASGLNFTNCFISAELFSTETLGTGAGVVVNNSFTSHARFNTCAFRGYSPAARMESGNVTLTGCSFKDFAPPNPDTNDHSVVANGGTLIVNGNQFFRTDKHVLVASTASKAIVTSNIFPGVTPEITVNLPPAQKAIANNV